MYDSPGFSLLEPSRWLEGAKIANAFRYAVGIALYEIPPVGRRESHHAHSEVHLQGNQILVEITMSSGRYVRSTSRPEEYVTAYQSDSSVNA